jgi:EAL domain-containing protein (putative c-di-GMP-specific phosphodiesterase class I)
VLATRIVLALPAAAARVPGLLEGAIPGYRLRNFRVALDLAGAEQLPRVARLRPDYVRVSADEDLTAWSAAAHAVGARLVVSRIEDAEDRAAALRAGADLLQGFHIGRPAPSLAAAELAA